jgi:hypothetical protein
MSKTLDGDFVNNSERNLETGRYLRKGYGNIEFMNGWNLLLILLMWSIPLLLTLPQITGLSVVHMYIWPTPRKGTPPPSLSMSTNYTIFDSSEKIAMTFNFKSRPLHPPNILSSIRIHTQEISMFPASSG